MVRRRPPSRDERTDVVRGVLLAMVGAGAFAGVANLPAALGPASWEGFGVADLVVGAFPVVAGVAIAHRRGPFTLRRLGRRLGLLVAAGLLVNVALHGLPLVWTGPLQQLAVASAIAAAVAGWPRARRLALGALLIGAHAWLLHASPLAGAGSLRPTANAAATVDQAVFGARALSPTDPWGLAALPIVVALVLAGIELGQWLRARPAGPATAAALVVQAAWLAVGGLGGAVFVPINRSLATPTWALLAAAFTFALFGAVHIALLLRGSRVLSPIGTVGRHGLVTVVALSAIGGIAVGDGTRGPWQGLRDGLLVPLAGDAWIWIYVAAGVLLAVVTARALERRNWRLTA